MNDQNPATKNNRAGLYTLWSLLKLLKYSKYLRKVPYFFKRFRNATTDPLQAIIGFLDHPELPLDLSQPLKHRMSKIQSQISDKSLSVKQQQILTSMVAAVFFSVAVRATADAVRFQTVVPGRPANPQSAGILPTPVQFALILLSRQRRDDVLSDLCDWAEHDGHFNAKCWLRLTSAFFGQLLDVLYRIGEVVGKFRGAK
jgi:hypothetical protein